MHGGKYLWLQSSSGDWARRWQRWRQFGLRGTFQGSLQTNWKTNQQKTEETALEVVLLGNEGKDCSEMAKSNPKKFYRENLYF